MFFIQGSSRKGCGTIHCIDPLGKCGCDYIGNGCVSVHVAQSFENTWPLPFPTSEAKTMCEAIGSIIRWPIQLLVLDNVESIIDVEHAEKLQDASSIRDSWLKKRVHLWNENRTQKLGEGVVLLVHPYEAINFTELGESHLGVILEKPLHTQPDSSPNYLDLPHLSLIPWPIKHLTLENGESLKSSDDSVAIYDGIEEILDKLVNQENSDISHLSLEDTYESDSSLSDVEVQNVNTQDFSSGKRKYVRRVRVIKTNQNPAYSKRCTASDVQKVAMIDCCNRNCCQMADRGKIMETRLEFWGQGYSQRSTYIYDSISMAYTKKSEKDTLLFVHNGMYVCSMAWYTIHGISKTTFYRYKRRFFEGAKCASHGNSEIIRKGHEHVEMGKALIQEFIDKNAEKMPHKSRTSIYGSRETQLVLPSMYKQVDIMREVNETLASLGYSCLSQPTFSRLWNTTFKTVSLSKTSTFSKCDICTAIKMKLESTKVQEERAKLFILCRTHMLQQMTCRNANYAWRTYSKLYPDKYLCIIHDKMDQKKTCIPRVNPIPKSLNQIMPLPISLTGMLTHGHGQNAYGHFALGFWPADPNFTIGSLSKCFQNLERLDNHMYGDLMRPCTSSRKSNQVLDNLMSSYALEEHMAIKNEKSPFCILKMEPRHKSGGNACNGGTQESMQTNVVPENVCLDSNKEGACSFCDECGDHQQEHHRNDAQKDDNATFKRLPRTLLLQLDNCGSENKNRYVFAYLSLLVAKGAFDMVQLGFLMVGHTHEDIDALFSRFSEEIRTAQVFSFPHLMKRFNECTLSHPAPFLMQQVPDFKEFVKGYLHEGVDRLVGHSKPLQFRFYMSQGIPLMQYKIHPTKSDWSPDEGIELWKRAENGEPLLPPGVPRVLPYFEYMKDHEKVIEGLQTFVNWWKSFVENKGEESAYAKWIGPVIQYWEQMIFALKTPCVEQEDVFHDFWPRSVSSPVATIEDAFVDEDNFGIGENEDHYCGPARNKPRVEFNPQNDVAKGSFVLVQPSSSIYPVWLGVATSDVDKEKKSETFLKVKVQYPIAKNKNASEGDVYKDCCCWTKSWRCNTKDP